MTKRLFFGCIMVLAGLVSGISYAAEQSKDQKIVMYYFRGTSRSPVCRHLEKVCREAVEDDFRDELASGKFDFRVVTLGNDGQGYYDNYYRVSSRMAILSLVENGRELRWKNLERIGEYINDKEGLAGYLRGEIASLSADPDVSSGQ
ncbi:MAG: hypothetical protein PHW98_03745 [Candidatus Omnitrophica bacterium]|nr:hypothetical protein [Candidatus Omnitrophota bacterium]